MMDCNEEISTNNMHKIVTMSGAPSVSIEKWKSANASIGVNTL